MSLVFLYGIQIQNWNRYDVINVKDYLSICSGVWSDFFKKMTHKSELSQKIEKELQIWTILKDEGSKNGCKKCHISREPMFDCNIAIEHGSPFFLNECDTMNIFKSFKFLIAHQMVE